jgi:hypothetical protein
VADPVVESTGRGLLRRMVSVVSGMFPFTLSIPGVTGALAALVSSFVLLLPQATSRPVTRNKESNFFIVQILALLVDTIILPRQKQRHKNSMLRPWPEHAVFRITGAMLYHSVKALSVKRKKAHLPYRCPPYQLSLLFNLK